jgi:hypothetical protein
VDPVCVDSHCSDRLNVLAKATLKLYCGQASQKPCVRLGSV